METITHVLPLSKLCILFTVCAFFVVVFVLFRFHLNAVGSISNWIFNLSAQILDCYFELYLL